MLKLKYADYPGNYHGFSLKKGFWYGINAETGNYIASSGWECNDNLAIYELDGSDWNMGWYDASQPEEDFELFNLPSYNINDKKEFSKWLEEELGITESYFENNYTGSMLEQVYERYNSYVYDGLPRFAINYIKKQYEEE